MSDYEKEVDFIKPFVKATLNTLKVQCHIEAKPGKPYFKDDPAIQTSVVDIAGVIGITSQYFTGSIAICFPEKTFLAIISSMLGEKFEKLTPDVEDGAGELMNIVFGQAKIELNENGHALQKALPSVIRGQNLNVRHVTKDKLVILPFETELGQFFVEVAFEKNKKGAS